MTEPSFTISVVIPCLNRAHYLRATIDSVLGQDFSDIECIVVDGGSADATVEILESYGDKISWTSERDRGHADAINKGWKRSTGDILAWLNADDTWAVPNAASRAAGLFAENPTDVVIYGDCGAIDDNGDVVGSSYLHEWDLAYAIENCDHCIPQPAAFVRREALEQVGWLDDSFISKKDHELWLRIGLDGRIRYVPGVLAYERMGPGYMAQRGDETARACVALTRKFFSLPDVPVGLREREKRSLSNAYLKGSDYAWKDGDHHFFSIGYVGRSLLADPSNWKACAVRMKTILKVIAVSLRRRLWKKSNADAR